MRKIPCPYSDPTPLFRHGGAPVPDGWPVLDFSVNVNPLGPPKSVLQALRRALPEIARYPDPECRALTERLAAEHGVSPDQIVVGNGSNELIHAIARAFRPKRVAIAEPTYTEYLRASLLVGAEVDHWLAEEGEFRPAPFDPEGADLVWLCNPNNPTGQIWLQACVMAAWMGEHPQSLFVVDEAFMPLSWMEKDSSLIAELHRLPNLIVLRSLTKFFALAGVRLGYAVAPPDRSERLREQLVPWRVNALAQVAGRTALNDGGFRERTQRWVEREHSYLRGRLQTLRSHLVVVGHHANFLLLRLYFRTAAELTTALRERGIVVRDASNFVGLDSNYVRVAVRKREENRRLVNELRSLLQGDSQACPTP
jgi:threonine-phosphate decarboxylase